MKTVRSGRFVALALLVLVVGSFGCKRGPKGPGEGEDGLVGGPLDPSATNVDGLETDAMRPTGPGMDAGSVLQTVYFDFDRSDIRPDMQPVLDQNAQYLQDNPDVQVQVEGHCDERGTVEYNFALGDRRAKSVRSYLMSRGVDGSRLVTISKGEEEPMAMGSGEDAYAQNRRAEFNFVN